MLCLAGLIHDVDSHGQYPGCKRFFFFVIPDSSPCGLFAKKCSRIMFCFA